MKDSIYHIEDDEDIAYGVKSFLQNKGFYVKTISTVEESKNILEKQLPALILMDWNLPDGSGDKLCQWIRTK